jgi:hypothetical protein
MTIAGMDLSDALLWPSSISCCMAVSMPFMVCAGACSRIISPLLISRDLSLSTFFIEHQPCKGDTQHTCINQDTSVAGGCSTKKHFTVGPCTMS